MWYGANNHKFVGSAGVERTPFYSFTWSGDAVRCNTPVMFTRINGPSIPYFLTLMSIEKMDV